MRPSAGKEEEFVQALAVICSEALYVRGRVSMQVFLGPHRQNLEINSKSRLMLRKSSQYTVRILPSLPIRTGLSRSQQSHDPLRLGGRLVYPPPVDPRPCLWLAMHAEAPVQEAEKCSPPPTPLVQLPTKRLARLLEIVLFRITSCSFDERGERVSSREAGRGLLVGGRLGAHGEEDDDDEACADVVLPRPAPPACVEYREGCAL